MKTDLQQLRAKAYGVVYIGLFSLLAVSGTLYELLPSSVGGLPKGAVIAGIALPIWLLLLIKMVPRCPNCGMGLFSILEISRVPIIVRSWVGDSCSGCGATLK